MDGKSTGPNYSCSSSQRSDEMKPFSPEMEDLVSFRGDPSREVYGAGYLAGCAVPRSTAANDQLISEERSRVDCVTM